MKVLKKQFFPSYFVTTESVLVILDPFTFLNYTVKIILHVFIIFLPVLCLD